MINPMNMANLKLLDILSSIAQSIWCTVELVMHLANQQPAPLQHCVDRVLRGCVPVLRASSVDIAMGGRHRLVPKQSQRVDANL